MHKPAFSASDRICPHCGSEELLSFKAPASDRLDGTSIDVVECAACSFAWQFPVARSTEDSARYFAQAYAAAATSETSYFNPKRRSATAEAQLDVIQGLPLASRSLLDLGGGNGYFARAAASANWQVTLIDPALVESEFTGTGVEAICGTSADAGGREFDVVTAWDVIEHVPYPGQFMEEAIARIKPGGYLIIETGNYKSAERAEVGRSHWIYQADHRWYFAPDSAGALIEACGLTEVTVHPRVLRPGWKGTPAYPGPSARQALQAWAREPWRVQHHLARHQRLKRAGQWPDAGLSIFTLIARKPALE